MTGCRSRQLWTPSLLKQSRLSQQFKLTDPFGMKLQQLCPWGGPWSSARGEDPAAQPMGRTLRLDSAFLSYSFPFPPLRRTSALERHVLPAVPKAHLCDTSENSFRLLSTICFHSIWWNQYEIQTSMMGNNAGSKVHSLFSPPSGSVIKIILVINVYAAPILFQNQLLYSATQMNLEVRMLKPLPYLPLLILKGQGLYLRFS